MTTLRSWRLRLPYERPPITLNSRGGWQKTHRLNKGIKEAAFYRARESRIPRMQRIAVTLEYVPRTRRNRDQDNLVATIKPSVDGLVAAGVVVDDDTGHVVHRMPIIREPEPTLARRGVFLIVEELTADD